MAKESDKNIYVVYRQYGLNWLLDCVLAKDIDEVYKFMLWEKKDKPPLFIRKVDKTEGCFLAHAIKDPPRSYLIKDIIAIKKQKITQKRIL